MTFYQLQIVTAKYLNQAVNLLKLVAGICIKHLNLYGCVDRIRSLI